MLKRLAGFGCLALLLCLPLQAEHRRHRSHHNERYVAPGFVEVYVATPHVQGAFVRGFRPAPYGYGYSRFDSYGYRPRGRELRKFKYKHRKYYKRHRHYHYDGYCPY